MKTLIALLLLTLGVGAAYWTTQRPGEGIDALHADVQSAVARVGGGVQAFRDSLASDHTSADAEGVDTLAAARTDITAAQSSIDALNASINARVDAIENQLTGTMTAAEAGVVEGRLDALEERLAEASTQTDDDTATVTAAMQETLEAMLERLESLEGNHALLTRRLDEVDVSEPLAQLNTRADDLAATVDALAETNTRLSDETTASVATLGERIDTLDTRIATISASAVSAAATDTDQAVVEVDAVLDQRIAAVEDKLGNARATELRMDALSNRFDSLEQALTEASDNDQSLREELGQIVERVSSLDTRADALSIDTVQQEIRAQLASLNDEVSNESGPDVDALSAALESTRERINALESRVQGLPASSDEAGDVQETQNALEAQIAALERRVETLPDTAADNALASSLSEVRERVDELSTRDFVTQEELRAQVEGKNIEYKIYFDKNSVDISPDAAQVLDSFISQETNRTTGVSIFGFTDRAGPALYNQELAERRAQTVRSYLIQNGFDFTKIGNVAGLGEDAAATLLEDDQEDAQQRVVVLYASQR